MKTKLLNLNTIFSFAQTKDDAELLYSKYKSSDPFPGIQPALLNSANIAEYVCLTGMIFPFNPEKLKPASYEAMIGKEVWYWDDKKEKKHNDNLQETDNICFRKNSITYISLIETFQIPDYIALRFNLTIKHVHRGILLGTGPLIDPGFQGKIMIPIHNLTPNDYIVRPCDAIINIEFTKLSPNNLWDKTIAKSKGDYVQNPMTPFPSFNDYFKKALPNGIKSVNSSIGNVLKESEDKIATHIKEMETFKSRITWGVGLGFAVTLFIGVVPLFWYTVQSFNTSHAYVTSAEQYVIEANDKFNNKLQDTVKENIVTPTSDRIIKIMKEDFLKNGELYKQLEKFLDEKIEKLHDDELSDRINEVIKKNEELIKRNAKLEGENKRLFNGKK